MANPIRRNNNITKEKEEGQVVLAEEGKIKVKEDSSNHIIVVDQESMEVEEDNIIRIKDSIRISNKTSNQDLEVEVM